MRTKTLNQIAQEAAKYAVETLDIERAYAELAEDQRRTVMIERWTPKLKKEQCMDGLTLRMWTDKDGDKEDSDD